MGQEMQGVEEATPNTERRTSSVKLQSNPQSAIRNQKFRGFSSASSKARPSKTFANRAPNQSSTLVSMATQFGGVSVGEPEEEMMRAVESSEPYLPNDKPRYAMGLGTPPQLLEMSRAVSTCSIASCRHGWLEMGPRSRRAGR
jgi:queuine/archaeosine tRNA-ribosyltransferase